MTENNVDFLLIQLLRFALGHGDSFSLPEHVDWNAVIQRAMSFGLDAIAFDGLQAIYDHSSPEEVAALDASLGEMKFDWLGFTLQAEQDYESYRRTLRDLAAFYNEEGIPMLLLKGYGLSLNYPLPQHRPTGDIDIYLFGEWEKADRALAQKRGIKIDNSHHHHTVFNFEGRSVENHYDILNIYANRSSRRLDRQLKGLALHGWTEHEMEGAHFRLPSANFNALFLLRHAASHFASVDISLRHVLDWLLFVREHHDQIDWDWLYSVLWRENMVHFANSLNAIGVTYLGFERDLFPALELDDGLVRRIFEEILCPSFQDKEDGTLWKSLRVKPARWWHNRWKHRLCYSDSLLSSFLHGLHAKLLKPSHFVH